MEDSGSRWSSHLPAAVADPLKNHLITFQTSVLHVWGRILEKVIDPHITYWFLFLACTFLALVPRSPIKLTVILWEYDVPGNSATIVIVVQYIKLYCRSLAKFNIFRIRRALSKSYNHVRSLKALRLWQRRELRSIQRAWCTICFDSS